MTGFQTAENHPDTDSVQSGTCGEQGHNPGLMQCDCAIVNGVFLGYVVKCW